MKCPQCKKENREDANFCRFCGNPMSERNKKEFELLPTTQGKRFLNLILDYISMCIVGFFLGVVFAILEIGIEGISYIFGIMVVLLYYVFFESIWAKTPAKFITKTRVVTINGEKPKFSDIFARAFIRCIPFEAFSFLGSKNPVGWHDKWTKTMVIDDT